jgi:hypothetical protein
MLHGWGRGEVSTEFWWGNLKERPRCRWEDNIKIDLQVVDWEGMN